MDYRIVDADKKQLKGTFSFTVGRFKVKVGVHTKGKVVAKNIYDSKETTFDNMDQFFEFLKAEEETARLLDEL